MAVGPVEGAGQPVAADTEPGGIVVSGHARVRWKRGGVEHGGFCLRSGCFAPAGDESHRPSCQAKRMVLGSCSVHAVAPDSYFAGLDLYFAAAGGGLPGGCRRKKAWMQG